MYERRKKKCPWCPEPNGCEGCSLTGEEPGNYKLLPETFVNRKIRKERHRWLLLTSALAGGFIAVSLVLLWVLVRL